MFKSCKYVDSFHEEIRFSCDYCGLKSIHKSHLKMHVDSYHKEIRFSFGLKAILKNFLKMDVHSFHEEIVFYMIIVDLKQNIKAILKCM